MDPTRIRRPPSDSLALTGKDALETRDQAKEVRIEATRKVAELEALEQAQTEALEKARAEIEAEFSRKRAELETQIAPLREQLAQITEVLWTVDLYLGRDESITQVREGAPAPADTPIVIRQRVLSMAEESLILLDAHGGRGMDAERVQEFLDWIVADDENLNRVLPEQKGVVVLVPTTIQSRTGDMFEDASRDAWNRQAHWLIRNGQNLYILTTDENLTLRERVLPRRDEFTSIFEKRLFGHSGPSLGSVKPGSEEWLAMEKRASALQRHYMRILLVLQGLIDRTTVWHPLPEGGANLLSLQDQDNGKIVLLQDEDPSAQIGDGRESFGSLRARLNSRLRPGLRVILSTGSDDFRHLAHDQERHPRIFPETANKPTPLKPYVIEGRRHGGLFIRYDRTDKVWKRNVPVPDRPGYVYREKDVEPSRRASLLFHTDDPWVLPLDLISEGDLRYYLNSRENRSRDLLEMVPLIKAALAVKEAEKAQEKPFRDLLEANLAAEGLESDVDALIHAWKVRNTFTRPLNGDPKHEARAAREIIREARMHQRAESQAEVMVPKARRLVPDAVAVAYQATSTPRWVALVPTVPGTMFYDIHPIPIRKNTTGPVEREVFMSHAITSRLITCWSTDEWDKVLTSPVQENQVLSPTEASRALDAALSLADREGVPALAVTQYADKTRPEDGWTFHVIWLGEKGDFVRKALAVTRNHRTKALEFAERQVSNWRGGMYSDPEFHMSVPWAGKSHDRWSDARHRLIWSDPEEMDRLREISREQKEAQARQRKAQDREYAEVRRWAEHIEAAVRAELERTERERFLEDFGPGHDDLWAGHLKSRSGAHSMRLPWNERTTSVHQAVRDRLSRGAEIAGITLADLLGPAVNREEFKDFAIPPLPSMEG